MKFYKQPHGWSCVRPEVALYKVVHDTAAGQGLCHRHVLMSTNSTADSVNPRWISGRVWLLFSARAGLLDLPFSFGCLVLDLWASSFINVIYASLAV